MVSCAAPKERAQANADLGFLQNLQLSNMVFWPQSVATTSSPQ